MQGTERMKGGEDREGGHGGKKEGVNFESIYFMFVEVTWLWTLPRTAESTVDAAPFDSP